MYPELQTAYDAFDTRATEICGRDTACTPVADVTAFLHGCAALAMGTRDVWSLPFELQKTLKSVQQAVLSGGLPGLAAALPAASPELIQIRRLLDWMSSCNHVMLTDEGKCDKDDELAQYLQAVLKAFHTAAGLVGGSSFVQVISMHNPLVDQAQKGATDPATTGRAAAQKIIDETHAFHVSLGWTGYKALACAAGNGVVEAARARFDPAKPVVVHMYRKLTPYDDKLLDFLNTEYGGGFGLSFRSDRRVPPPPN